MVRNGNAKTRRFALNMLKAGVAISGAALLFACGDDSSSGADGSQTATGVDSTVESIDDLLNCTSKHEGETAYIKEEKATYVCVDGDWITGSISESVDDLLNCTSKHEGETVFVKEDKEIYICTDGDWVVAGETDDEGDDDGEKSSSSKAKSSSSVESSSSVIPGSDPESSSSDGNDDGKSSSSSTAKSSSSVESSSSRAKSSSSVKSSSSKAKSSSSDKEVSSSSVTLSEVEGSSSSVIAGSDPESSSSDGNDDGKSSSSSTAKSSSSEGGGGASSSSVIASSSSEELVSSSSFNKSSSSSRGLFEMSKDEFLNPKVSYGEMTDKRDGKKYKTVKIGDQVWMAENLNYDYNKGTAKSYCYGGIEANCDVTGRLYTWAAAIDSVALANDADNPQTCGYGKTCTLPTVVQGVCPEGWHLPSYGEWETLFTAVGGKDKAGTALKSQTGWYSQTGDAADRDAYGFSALPAGYRDYNGHFGGADSYAYFWPASENDSNYAYSMRLYYGNEDAGLYLRKKFLGFSVRCLQN